MRKGTCKYMSELTKEDLMIIFDVLNVYDPNDIDHVYPPMGKQEFLDGVKTAWEKVLNILEQETEWDNSANQSRM